MVLMRDVIDRIKQRLGVSSDADVARALSVEPQSIVNWRKRGTIPWPDLYDFSEKHGIAVDWLLHGTEKQTPPDANELIAIIKEQNNRIEEQGRRIDEQSGLLVAQKDLIAAQGERITEQGKRIDMIADMARTSQNANVILAKSVESIQGVLNKQHEKMITAAATGDLAALGD